MMVRYRFILFTIAITVAIMVGSDCHAQDIDRLRQLKAAFLFNFIKYTDWPNDAFAQNDSPIKVVVVGDSRFAAILGQLITSAKNSKVAGRDVVVEHVAPPDPTDKGRTVADYTDKLRSAQAVFIGSDNYDVIEMALETVRGVDALTVSDASDFAERGGMLGMVLRGGRYSIEASPDAIKKTRLKVSSDLLRLARIVK